MTIIHPPFLAVCQCVSTFFTFCRQKNFTLLVPCWQKQGWTRFHENTCPPFFSCLKKFDKIAAPPDLGGSCHNINFPPAHRPPSLFPMGGDPTPTSWWFVRRKRFWNIFKFFQSGSAAGLLQSYVAFFAVSGNEVFLTIWRLVQLAQLVIGPDCWCLMLESPKCCRD